MSTIRLYYLHISQKLGFVNDMHVCVHPCMFAFVFICVYVCTWVCVFVFAYTWVERETIYLWLWSFCAGGRRFASRPWYYYSRGSFSSSQLVFGMIITDPEHWRLRLKWREFYGIIAQQTPSPINPAMQSAAGLFWFVTSSCFRLMGKVFSAEHGIYSKF